MRKLLSQLLALKIVWIDNGLAISYCKIDDSALPKNNVGYVDIATVAKRYEKAENTIGIKNFLQQTSVKDNLYFIEHVCSAIAQNCASGKHWLDVGCGGGGYSAIFKNRRSLFNQIQYSGTEIDQKIVDVCRRYHPGSQFFVSTADQIAAHDQAYDVVFCSGILHYTLDKWKASIAEMTRVSKQYLLLTRFPVTKYRDSFYVQQTVKSRQGTERHYFIVLNRDQLEQIFARLGLSIVKRDYTSDSYTIESIDETIVLVQYALKKITKTV